MRVEMDNGEMRNTAKFSFTFLIHNMISHFWAAPCYFFGWEKLGNKIHSFCKPKS